MLNTLLLLLATVSGPSRPVVKPNDFKSLVQAQKQKGKVKKNKKTQNIEDELIVLISVDF